MSLKDYISDTNVSNLHISRLIKRSFNQGGGHHYDKSPFFFIFYILKMVDCYWYHCFVHFVQFLAQLLTTESSVLSVLILIYYKIININSTHPELLNSKFAVTEVVINSNHIILFLFLASNAALYSIIDITVGKYVLHENFIITFHNHD